MDGVAKQEAGKLDRAALAEALQAEVQATLRAVADAVNAAPVGNVISGSEMEVRDLMAALRKRVFEQALQMRADSAESAFSPGAGRRRTGLGE